jgi:hypothetical protein
MALWTHLAAEAVRSHLTSLGTETTVLQSIRVLLVQTNRLQNICWFSLAF